MLGKKIRQLRKLKGFTTSKLAEASGVNPSYISMIEKGKRKNPTLTIINNIASVLEVPVDLLTNNNIKPEDVTQILVTKNCNKINETDNEKYDSNLVKPATIFGQVCPETGLLKDVIGFDCLPLSKMGTANLFEFELRDNSLIEKGIKQGDFIIARYQIDINNGDIAVIAYKGQLLVRRAFAIDGKLILTSFNKDFPPMEVNRWDVNLHIIGKVVGVKVFF